MSQPTSESKSCDPQLSSEDPQSNWDLDRLRNYARARNDEIDRVEYSLTELYWRLGCALNVARRHFGHGQWGKFLEEQGVDKTRSSRACAIHRTFDSVEAVKDLSVQEAYDRRKRKNSKTRDVRESKPLGLSDWLIDIHHKANFFLDEAGYAKGRLRAALLTAIDSAITELGKLRDQVSGDASKC